MESGSREDRLCQAVTSALARVRLTLFWKAYFHTPYFWNEPLSPMRDYIELESLGAGGCINSSTHAGSHAEINLNPGGLQRNRETSP